MSESVEKKWGHFHSPEPWTLVYGMNPRYIEIRDANEEPIITLQGELDPKQLQQLLHDLGRAVDAVNACIGISESALRHQATVAILSLKQGEELT